MVTFIIAAGQNELLTKSDIGEVPECHVTHIADTAKRGYGWRIREQGFRVQERDSRVFLVFFFRAHILRTSRSIKLLEFRRNVLVILIAQIVLPSRCYVATTEISAMKFSSRLAVEW